MQTVSSLNTTSNFAFRCFVSKSKFDGYSRCKACLLKYDSKDLIEFGGHMICRFCLKDLETHLKGVKNV